MSTDPPSRKPLPSVEEINAYLESSAARTKKRLNLAPGNARPTTSAATPAPTKVDRKLPIGGTKAPRADAAKAPASPDASPAPPPAPDASVASPRAEPPTEPAWSPFSADDDP